MFLVRSFNEVADAIRKYKSGYLDSEQPVCQTNDQANIKLYLPIENLILYSEM